MRYIQNDGQPFLTGSHAYGTPGESSDVDVVVLGDKLPASLIDLLTDNADSSRSYDRGEHSVSIDRALMFGKLNLLIMSEERYNAWNRATRFLKEEAAGQESGAVLREYAISIIEEFEADEQENPTAINPSREV